MPLDDTLDNVKDYFNSITQALSKVPSDFIVVVCSMIHKVRANSGVVYIIGNGGSAAVADHLACDLSFVLSRWLKSQKIKALSLTGGYPLISAISNDVGYINVYKAQLDGVIMDKDMLIVFSTSGDSPNLRVAAIYAKLCGAQTVGILGHDWGHLKDIVDAHILIDVYDQGAIEDVFSIISHAIVHQLEKDIQE